MAQVTATLAGGGTIVGTLTNTYQGAGTCGGGLTCSNQSDYTLVKLVANPVPEAATLGLLGAALLGVGAAARARRR